MAPITVKKKMLTVKAPKPGDGEAQPESGGSEAESATAPTVLKQAAEAPPPGQAAPLTLGPGAAAPRGGGVSGAVFAAVAVVAALIFGVVLFMQWAELQFYRGAFLDDPRAAVLSGGALPDAAE
ncbi:MAG: hypothetical protein JW951_01050 [Lentisphaerae bacterium]|nr:hypothetical protein [Lentisphaerota bacterium]